jgi:hypothetical protein
MGFNSAFKALIFPSSHTLVYFNEVKAIPLEAWTGPEGSRRLKLPDVQTIGI